MKAVIIYDSLHGSTGKCAVKLSSLLKAEVEIKHLEENDKIDLDAYDMVIIGGSIHHGMIQMKIEHFLKEMHENLLKKKLGLYLCCIEEGATARRQFENAFPSELRAISIADGLFGGELNLKKMNYFERTLTQKVTGIKFSVSKINYAEIERFAEKINNNT